MNNQFTCKQAHCPDPFISDAYFQPTLLLSDFIILYMYLENPHYYAGKQLVIFLFLHQLENIVYNGICKHQYASKFQELREANSVGTLKIYFLVHALNPNSFQWKKQSKRSQIPYLHHSHGGCWADLLKGYLCFYPNPLAPTNKE